MEPTSKLRVVVPDGANALRVVTTEIEEATGIALEPELQEVDGDDLVVELRLADSSICDPKLVVRAVERLSDDLEVLSTWQEAPPPRDPAPVTSQSVFAGPDVAMPEVAQRAFRDGLPTAHWPGTVRVPAGEPKACWQLAVPIRRSDGRVLVGVLQCGGYSHRFGLHEAKALRLGLAS
jgi:hypothetical protein